MKFQVSRQIFFEKIFKHQISWKSVQWGPEMLHADGQTRQVNSRFSQFCERAFKKRGVTWETMLQKLNKKNLGATTKFYAEEGWQSVPQYKQQRDYACAITLR